MASPVFSQQALATKIRGRVILPGVADYEQQRRVWNHDVDKRPVLIVQCVIEDDIRNALEFARTHNLPISVRGGGHSFAGYGTCDGGAVIDLSQMKRLRIDPHQGKASLEAGVVGGELDQVAQAFGLAVPLGSCPSVGVVGYAAGGGEGSLTPSLGFACDSILRARVLTHDSTILTAEAESNQDLFWALRGGGGNFGIITELDLALRHVDTVLGGHLTYPLRRMREVLNFVNGFVEDIPPELYIIIAVLPQPGEPMLDIGIVWSGVLDEGERVVRPLRKFSHASKDSIKAKRYLDEQQSGSDSPSEGDWCSVRRAGHLRHLDSGAIDVIERNSARGPAESRGITMIYWHGPWVERSYDNAFGFRRRGFEYWVHAYWQDPAQREPSHQWVDNFYHELQPFSTGAVYVNNLCAEGPERVKAAYGEKYQRLIEIKRKYDPDNVFRLNENISL